MNSRLLPKYTTRALSLLHPEALHELTGPYRPRLGYGLLSFQSSFNHRGEDVPGSIKRSLLISPISNP